MARYIDFDAARERLQAITTDDAIPNRFYALRQAGKPVILFLTAVHDANLSLDYVLFGHGKPSLPREDS